MSFIWVSLVAFLAGVGSYYSWDRNKPFSLFAIVVALVAASIAVIMAFVSTVVFIFKLIPIILLAAAIFILYKILTKDRN